MADRALRGMRMGSNSLESEEGVSFVERQEVSYTCPAGHTFVVPLALEAEVPETWECQSCSEMAARDGVDEIEEEKPARAQRTHWDMLRERRKISELEVLLEERLELLRSGKIRRFR